MCIINIMIDAELIEKIYNKFKNTTGGKNADYIPELGKVNPKLYGISLMVLNGENTPEEINEGDCRVEFAIESCSKVFTLALALETYGIKNLKTNIGISKSTDKFNSISSIEKTTNHTINSFYNGGAMATTSLLYDKNKDKFVKTIIDNMSEFANRKLRVNKKIYKSEMNNIAHNLSIAYLLKSYKMFYGEVHSCVDVYTQQCSAMVTCRDIAMMAAVLANDGVHPVTKKRLLDTQNVKYIIELMKINGLYEETDDWMKLVGLPAKSGVGGALLIVVPGKMGIGIYSPPLNSHGNSVKGIKTAIVISKNLH